MKHQLDLRVDDRYKLVRKLGEGSFGAVYQALDLRSNEAVAIKLEHVSTDPSILRGEAQVYNKLSGGVGIPATYWNGFECEFNVLVLELLGPSLEDLFNYCRRKFSLKTVLMIADQLIARLQYLHSRDVIHRDVKPENFLMGRGRSGNQVYVTDFGLAWSDFATTSQRSKSLIGTARFASVNAHGGHEQSDADDLESLGYMLVYFLQGSLPWQGLHSTQEGDKDQLVLRVKEMTATEDLCHGLPQEFGKYFDHIRTCRGRPNHAMLRKRFQSLFRRERYEHDHVFDWTELKFAASRLFEGVAETRSKSSGSKGDE